MKALHIRGNATIYVKIAPPENFGPDTYLDILDAERRVEWLVDHPKCGVIVASLSSKEYLEDLLKRPVILIPQHHCNYERLRRFRKSIRVAGVIGGPGAVQCDLDELNRTLGIEFRWQQKYRSRQDVVDFYKDLDVQVVWRLQQRPLKNPLKIINAASFGIPTIAYPEIAYKEIDGLYFQAETMEHVAHALEIIRQGFDDDGLVMMAEKYHIERIAKLYEALGDQCQK